MDATGGDLHSWAEIAARGLEFAGVGVMLLGLVAATAWGLWRLRGGLDAAYAEYRANLGRAILLGLELLVAADIISTVTSELTFQSVGLLAAVIAIRTFLSFALETEIEGRWPWRRTEIDRKGR
ncbi:DUF1622 domain-containing protein [Brevundimonas sp. NIBR11]|uniref:DUF1622 domain-containing protein n=1 Tax=Brevundimonas sp. NIBR11 TaxID=3015999 RepID=UPI0022F13468|nr:DUF1622 domain-containing protein [Brevundimonas sp. NIBR11]